MSPGTSRIRTKIRIEAPRGVGTNRSRRRATYLRILTRPTPRACRPEDWPSCHSTPFPGVPGSGRSGADDVAGANGALVQDPGTQAAAVNEPAHDTSLRETLQMPARLAKPRPPPKHLPHPDLPVHEEAQRDADRHDIAPGIPGR